uniref:Uncharacterized protein n=1 Tax=Anguilla anguilla TaxID=7936 RepID=A0A0E9P5I5_ANGAN
MQVYTVHELVASQAWFSERVKGDAPRKIFWESGEGYGQ